jgi:vacuolar-type H+-ATPase subunit E/Vma4
MALPELLDALRRQAAEHRAEELAEADAEAERIAAEARASLERRRSDAIERARREEGEAARRAVSRAEKEAAESVLTARDRLLGRVAAALAERAARAVGDPDYLVALPGEIRAGLERLPPGPVVVRVRPELVGIVRDAVQGRHDVTVEPVEAIDVGFTATVPESGVEVDGTLPTRLAHAWPSVAVSVLREVTG